MGSERADEDRARAGETADDHASGGRSPARRTLRRVRLVVKEADVRGRCLIPGGGHRRITGGSRRATSATLVKSLVTPSMSARTAARVYPVDGSWLGKIASTLNTPAKSDQAFSHPSSRRCLMSARTPSASSGRWLPDDELPCRLGRTAADFRFKYSLHQAQIRLAATVEQRPYQCPLRSRTHCRQRPFPGEAKQSRPAWRANVAVPAATVPAVGPFTTAPCVVPKAG